MTTSPLSPQGKRNNLANNPSPPPPAAHFQTCIRRLGCSDALLSQLLPAKTNLAELASTWLAQGRELIERARHASSDAAGAAAATITVLFALGLSALKLDEHVPG